MLQYMSVKYEIVKDEQDPERSCLISSFSGMSWMAALIFSLMSLTAFCHFKLQWRRSRSQSADKWFTGETCGSESSSGNTCCTQMKHTLTLLNITCLAWVYLPKSLLVCMSIGRFWIFCWSETNPKIEQTTSSCIVVAVTDALLKKTTKTRLHRPRK